MKPMKTGILHFIAFVIIFSSFISGCTPKARYERRLKHELATGVRYDSLFMGLYLGMPEKDFYTHCWKLNKRGLIRQGSNNTTVEYQMRNELKYPATMNFYPSFIDNRIAEMPVKFAYSGWAPWNQKLSSDSLQVDVIKWFEKKYGNHFMKIDHPDRGSAYIKLNGNRRVTVFKQNDMNVWAIFSDMSVVKEMNNTSGQGIIPDDTTKVLK
jgi:hypothetical protein